MTSSTRRCKVHARSLRRCGNPSVGCLEICQPCLDILLDEADPQRRRTLAASENIPASVVERLACDRDEHVRARVAARADLGPALAQRVAAEAGGPPGELSLEPSQLIPGSSEVVREVIHGYSIDKQRDKPLFAASSTSPWRIRARRPREETVRVGGSSPEFR